MLKKILAYLHQMTLPKEALTIDNIDYIRIKTANQIIFFTFFMVLLLFSFTLLTGKYAIVVIDVLSIVILYFCYYLNQHAKAHVGIPLFVLFTISAIFLSLFFVPYSPGVSIMLVPMVGLPILFISPKQKVIRTFSIIVCIVFYFYAEFNISPSQKMLLKIDWPGSILMSSLSFIFIILQYKFWEVINLSSRHKLIEQQGQLTASAQLSDLGIMSTGIAHEINNPLTIIQALNYKMFKCIDVLPAKCKANMVDGLARQKKSIVRINKIVIGLRILSRNSENDPMLMENLHHIIQESIAFCYENAKSRGIDVTIENDNFDVEILCQRIQFEHVILSLLTNSLEAISDQKNPWVKIVVNSNDDEVIIRVIDCGDGIKDEIKGDILVPFFTTKSIGKGLGLGLYISSQVIEKYKGELTFSAGEEHTCFQIKLPCIQSLKIAS